MDNRYQRFTAKEKEQFVEWWNTGVPTDELAERFRRPKTAINALVTRLRKEGFTLISLYDRFQAVRDYKTVRALEQEDVDPALTLDELYGDDASDDIEELSVSEPDAEFELDTNSAPPADAPSGVTVSITTITLVNGIEISRVTTYKDRDRL